MNPAAPRDLRIGLVGPLPPPFGGMANQTRQLAGMLQREGLEVEVIRTNAEPRFAWIGRIRGLRALFRLLPYLVQLWRAAGRVSLFHVMANSGWAWYLHACPAVGVAKLKGIPVIVNYRGGGAETFFSGAGRLGRAALAWADALVTPSGFLKAVFERFGFQATVIPNIVDLERFRPAARRPKVAGKHIVVTRNLEPIYDIASALAAFARVRARIPEARLTVAGTGPELERLQAMTRALGIQEAVTFAGRVANEHMPFLYQSADVMLNPSRVDNMPISILEAFASGVPVVSTDAGGIPYIAEHERTALLVKPGDAQAMADALVRVLVDAELAARLARAGLEEARRYRWEAIRGLWLAEYGRLSGCRLPVGTGT
jgi:glycosyltransferase involved in cell wall biosynthesis